MFAYTGGPALIWQRCQAITLFCHCLILNFKECFCLLSFLKGLCVCIAALRIVPELALWFAFCPYSWEVWIGVGTFTIHTSNLSSHPKSGPLLQKPHLPYSMFYLWLDRDNRDWWALTISAIQGRWFIGLFKKLLGMVDFIRLYYN